MKRAPNALWFLAWLSLVVHVFWIIFVAILFLGPAFAPSNELPDEVAAAYQLGRLDVVSLSVTVLASVLAVGAFSGFFLVRGAAMQAASQETENQLPKLLEDYLNKGGRGELINIILEEQRILYTLANLVNEINSKEGAIDEDAANEIADSFWSGKDE